MDVKNEFISEYIFDNKICIYLLTYNYNVILSIIIFLFEYGITKNLISMQFDSFNSRISLAE